MQQDASITQKAAQRILCLCNSIANFICSNQKCNNSAYVCGSFKCQNFIKRHPNCQFLIANNLIKQIQSKRVVITPKLEEAVAYLLKIYQEAIQQLSKDRDSLLNWKQNIGLNISQRQFITHIHEGTVENIKGKLVSDIKKNVDSLFVQTSKFDLSRVQKFWKKESVKFSQLRNRITCLYDRTEKKYNQISILEWDKDSSYKAVQFQQNIAKYKGQSQYRFAFACNSEVQTKNPIFWGFKINQLNSWIAVGMGDKKSIIKRDYQWLNFSLPGHGGYLISANGYTWSNSEAKQNQKNTNFLFNKQDSIYCCYDYSRNCIKFVKNKNQLKFKLTVTHAKDMPFAPCVLFHGKQSSVSLIEVDEQIQW